MLMEDDQGSRVASASKQAQAVQSQCRTDDSLASSVARACSASSALP